MNRFLSLSLAGLFGVLTACGTDEAAAPIAVASPSAPAAAAAAVPVSDKQAVIKTSAVFNTAPVNPFASFDFKGGTVYPQRASASIGTVSVPVGATEVFVPVRLNAATPNTVIAKVMTRNGSGTLGGLERTHFQRVVTTVIFRPGDPLEQTVRIPLIRMDAGRTFDLIFPEGVIGANASVSVGKITAVVGAAPTVAKTVGFRPARTFATTGTLSYRLDPAKATWSDAGGPDTFMTRLHFGRTQTANGETGLYLDPVLHRSPLPPFAVENGELVIRSQQLVSPILHNGTLWYKGAAMLTGIRMPATQIQYGQYDWTAMMPNRRGSWPALWLASPWRWPPEIDVYEGFGYSSGWNFTNNIAANIHGGSNGNRTFTALMQVNAQEAYGLSGFDNSYHRFSVDIAPDFITWFVDNREVYQTVNPFRGTNWYPLMNVAVKQSGNYAGGTAEMRLRSFTVWRVPG